MCSISWRISEGILDTILGPILWKYSREIDAEISVIPAEFLKLLFGEILRIVYTDNRAIFVVMCEKKTWEMFWEISWKTIKKNKFDLKLWYCWKKALKKSENTMKLKRIILWRRVPYQISIKKIKKNIFLEKCLDNISKEISAKSLSKVKLLDELTDVKHPWNSQQFLKYLRKIIWVILGWTHEGIHGNNRKRIPKKSWQNPKKYSRAHAGRNSLRNSKTKNLWEILEKFQNKYFQKIIKMKLWGEFTEDWPKNSRSSTCRNCKKSWGYPWINSSI